MLELEAVGFRYHRGTWLFRGVSFAVPAASTTAVLGPNGRGKTTLVRCAAGMLRPVEGSVHRGGPVGYVPQTRGGAFGYRVADMVLMGRASKVHPFASPGRSDRLAAQDAMERVGVAELADRAFPTLSGGEQQLVLIARAVAAGQPTLVLDEPATGLDLRNQARVLTLLRDLAGAGMAVLLTTHQPEHAMFLADAVVLLVSPDDVRVGPAPELLTDEALTALYGIEVRTVGAAGAGPRAVLPCYDAVRVSRSPSPDRSAPRGRW